MSGRVTVVVGGLAGSEAKGAAAGYLCRQSEFGPGLAIRVAGPNAGHSAADPDGTVWALRQVPVAAVTNPDAILAIAAGSEIDTDVLIEEVSRLEAGGIKIRHRLVVDPQATMIAQRHKDAEGSAGLVGRIGSTGKGIGAARADRIMRRASLAGEIPQTVWDHLGAQMVPIDHLARATLLDDLPVLIEGTQGWALGLHAGMYPQCTSSDCRAVDFLAMAGISPWDPAVADLQVVISIRPYPIRVAGNSGPLEGETTWEELGLPTERTTVTQKVRRVGSWNPDWVKAALAANGGPADNVWLHLSMADQIDGEMAGGTHPRAVTAKLDEFRQMVEGQTGSVIKLIGTSPRTMLDLR